MLGARMFGGFNVILMIFKALEAPSALQRFIFPPAVALMPLTFIGPWTRRTDRYKTAVIVTPVGRKHILRRITCINLS